ncbi:hypothetical protein MAR_017361, partial [Mya arenaria]
RCIIHVYETTVRFDTVGLFEPEEKAQKLSFTNAIEKLNLNVVGSSHMVVYYVEEVLPNDSFEANKGEQGSIERTYKQFRKGFLQMI